jgi:hypothetical protein
MHFLPVSQEKQKNSSLEYFRATFFLFTHTRAEAGNLRPNIETHLERKSIFPYCDLVTRVAGKLAVSKRDKLNHVVCVGEEIAKTENRIQPDVIADD